MHPRRRLPLSVLLLVAILPLVCCSRLLVLADARWWTAAGGDDALRRAVVLTALRHGYLPRFVGVAASEDARERLGSALGTGRFAAAVVGPLASSDLRETAVAFPQVTFILVGGPANEDDQTNTVQLVFDRRAAYAQAGGEAVRAAGRADAVGVLFSAERSAGPEVEAFLQAVRAGGSGEPVVSVLPQQADAASVRAAVAGMRSRGVAVLLARLAGHGSALLEALGELGGAAVVEDWAASSARPNQVLVSVEDDLIGGLAECLGQRGRGTQVVSGTVRLVRGKAKS